MTDLEKKAANAMARDIESYLCEMWDGASDKALDRWAERISGMNYAFKQIELPVQAIWETDVNVVPHFPIGVSVNGQEYIIFDKCREKWEKSRQELEERRKRYDT